MDVDGHSHPRTRIYSIDVLETESPKAVKTPAEGVRQETTASLAGSCLACMAA
jgi:hypothetical protein